MTKADLPKKTPRPILWATPEPPIMNGTIIRPGEATPPGWPRLIMAYCRARWHRHLVWIECKAEGWFALMTPTGEDGLRISPRDHEAEITALDVIEWLEVQKGKRFPLGERLRDNAAWKAREMERIKATAARRG